MPRLRVHNFAISVDGYGAGPNQDRNEPLGVGGGIRLFSQKGMEPVRLEKTEISEAGQITNMRFRFAGSGREFTKGYTKRRVL